MINFYVGVEKEELSAPIIHREQLEKTESIAITFIDAKKAFNFLNDGLAFKKLEKFAPSLYHSKCS